MLRRAGAMARRRGWFRAAALAATGPIVALDLEAEGTFSRSTQASVFNASTGVLTCYGVDVLRPGLTLDYTLEGPATNDLVAPADLGNAAWTVANATLTTDVANGPDATAGAIADQLDFDASASAQARQWGRTVSAATYTGSFFCQALSGTESAEIQLREGTGNNLAGTPQSFGTTWKRLVETQALASGADGGMRLINDGATARSLYAVYAQLEQSGFATSYICDSGGSRTQDDFAIPAATWQSNLNGKRIYIDVKMAASRADGPTVQYVFYRTGGGEYLRFNGTSVQLNIGGVGIMTATVGSYAAGDKFRFTIDPDNGELRVDKNGAFQDVEYMDSWSWGGTGQYQIGAVEGTLGSPLYGEISKIFEVPVADGDALVDYTEGSFTRATDAWLLDERTSSLAFYSFSSGEARIASDGAVLIEDTTTNEILQSPWDVAGTNVTLNGTSSDVPASGIPDSGDLTWDASSGRLTSPNLGILLSTDIHISAWVKNKVAGQSETLRFAYNDADGTTQFGPDFTTQDDWTKHEFQFTTAGAGSSQVQGQLRAASTGFTGNAVLVSLYQVETSSDYDAQPVLTDGASATKNSDFLEYTGGTPAIVREGVWEIDVWPVHDDTVSGFFRILTGGGGDGSIVLTGGNLRLYYSTSSFVNCGSLTWSPYQKITIKLDWPNNLLTVSGATTGNGSTDISTAVEWAAGAMAIGANSGGAQKMNALFSRIRRVIP